MIIRGDPFYGISFSIFYFIIGRLSSHISPNFLCESMGKGYIIYFDCNLSNLLGYIFGRSDKIPPSDEETLIRQSVSSWTSEFLFATFSSLTFYDFFLPFLLLKCLLSSCLVVARLVTSVL